MSPRMFHPLRLCHSYLNEKPVTVAIVVRVLFLLWSNLQDECFEVPYTDIDYFVVSDASGMLNLDLSYSTGGHVRMRSLMNQYLYHVPPITNQVHGQGDLPLGRTTYRYSPFVAIFLLGNYHTFIGKISFITGDIITGWLVQRPLDSLGCPEKVRFVSTVVWMLNPYTITMATRGSFESITSALLVGVLHSVLENQVVIAAILYGIVTHLRIYPIIFSIPFAFFFFGENKKNAFGVQDSMWWCGNRRDSRCLYSLISRGAGTKTKEIWQFFICCVFASLFVLLAFANYFIYGFDFLRRRSFIICTGGTSDTTSRRLFMENISHQLPQA